MSGDELPVAGTVVLLRDRADGIEVLLMRRPRRGSFAGAWVFPGGRVEDSDRVPGADEEADARAAGIRETREEVGLEIADPVVLSRWEPPVEAPVRVRTWFFVAAAPEREVRSSEGEVEETAWTTPAAALELHAAGEWRLFPPTWVTLHRLAGVESVDSALASAGLVRLFTTRVVESTHGTVFDWGGLRLETVALPWRLVEE